MKKIIFLGCLLLTTTVSVFAQSFNLGVKAGMNLAKLSTDFTDENRLGYQFGVWSRIGAAGIYVQPEFYLGTKGGEVKNIANSNVDAKVRFTTLDVPVLLGTKVGVDAVNFRFMAGPVISFIVSDKTTFSSGAASVTDFDNYKNQAWGLQGGVGVDISKISIDVRYEAGLSNTSNVDKYEQKANLWHLSLGYKFL